LLKIFNRPKSFITDGQVTPENIREEPLQEIQLFEKTVLFFDSYPPLPKKPFRTVLGVKLCEWFAGRGDTVSIKYEPLRLYDRGLIRRLFGRWRGDVRFEQTSFGKLKALHKPKKPLKYHYTPEQLGGRAVGWPQKGLVEEQKYGNEYVQYYTQTQSEKGPTICRVIGYKRSSRPLRTIDGTWIYYHPIPKDERERVEALLGKKCEFHEGEEE